LGTGWQAQSSNNRTKTETLATAAASHLYILGIEDGQLTGLQPEFRESRRRKPRAFGAAAFVCLALLAVVQVAHMHPLASDADHCPLCIAMHSAAPVAVMAAVVVLVKFGAPAPLVEARAVIRHWNPRHFTRPPPTGC
jgi:hypothetical protein